MVVKTLLKRGIKKLTKKKPKTKPKTKPTPRYRTDPKTGERFLNRRATVSGKKGITKKETIGTLGTYGTGVAAGAGATYLGMKNKATKKRKETQAKLKEATDKIREKDKKKKEKRKDNQRQK